jgi:predicted acylesterase/phospholipase RssA
MIKTTETGALTPAQMPDPLDPATRPPMNQYCDVVLKGGVVDGVIYPGVLTELARHYRFQGIAGTSVGAIAASITAASEYARRFGSDDGFNEVLRKIPDELAKCPNPKIEVTKLRSLFQPDNELKRLFATFIAVVSVPARTRVVKGVKVKGSLASSILKALLLNYFWILFIGLILGEIVALILQGTALFSVLHCLYLVSFKSWFTPTLACNLPSRLLELTPTLIWPGLLTGLLGSLALLTWVIRKEVQYLSRTTGFGFCGGLATKGSTEEGLIDWLHKGIQGAAKLPLNRPLTFQDLWDAPGGPKDESGKPIRKSIDLRMMSTAVSHGRPYEFPSTDSSTQLFFRLKDFAEYFPEGVMEHLRNSDNAQPYTEMQNTYYSTVKGMRNLFSSPFPWDVYANPACADDGADKPDLSDLRELPIAQMPVIVAVRLSMNFPVLFKALPLWSIDAEAGRVAIPPRTETTRFRRMWFSDGGITTNFPIHIFDSPVPAWPTFGVYISDRNREDFYTAKPDLQKKRFFLPSFHTTGRWERWQLGADDPQERKNTMSNGTGFLDYLANIFYSAKDWADNANMRMPGIRDRVVTVFQMGNNSGGLNLNLKPHQILALAYENGVDAGRQLVKKFLLEKPIAPSGNEALVGSPNWLDHRWVRLNSYIASLKDHISGFSDAVNFANGVSSIKDQIDQAQYKPPFKFEKYFEPTLNELQASALKEAVDAIERLEKSLNSNNVTQPYIPQPQPELKARSRL